MSPVINGQAIPLTQYITLDDGESYPLSGNGWGKFFVGDFEAFAYAFWQSDGTVTLWDYGGSVTDSDTPGYFCIYKNGSIATLKNNLGAQKVVKMSPHY